MSEALDVAVIGGGPAGVPAAVGLGRAGARVAMFEPLSVGGHAINVETVEMPGQLEQSGPDFAASLLEQVLEEGLDLRLGQEATHLRRSGGGWGISVDGAEVEARAVIVCTGSGPRSLPGRPEVEKDPLVGSGIFTCAICDAPFYKGKRVAVAGGGDTGVEGALTLARHGASVILFEREPRLPGCADLAQELRSAAVDVRLETEVEEAIGDGRLEGIRTVHGGAAETAPVDGLLLAVGIYPRSTLAAGVLDLDEIGMIRVDDDLRASAIGAFAAGDVRAGAEYRCAAAARDGRAAAESALRFLGAI